MAADKEPVRLDAALRIMLADMGQLIYPDDEYELACRRTTNRPPEIIWNGHHDNTIWQDS